MRKKFDIAGLSVFSGRPDQVTEKLGVLYEEYLKHFEENFSGEDEEPPTLEEFLQSTLSYQAELLFIVGGMGLLGSAVKIAETIHGLPQELKELILQGKAHMSIMKAPGSDDEECNCPSCRGKDELLSSILSATKHND